MRLLARREHAAAELAAKLEQRGYARAAIDAEIEQLAAEGLQSDERFAMLFVEQRVARGDGPLKLRWVIGVSMPAPSMRRLRLSRTNGTRLRVRRWSAVLGCPPRRRAMNCRNACVSCRGVASRPASSDGLPIMITRMTDDSATGK
ncbi:MAG: RecX family transcriptional regulator [Halofilum sp. (in: g-proteobacteria)]